VFADGVKCWGDASGGQLGYAAVKNLGDDETLGNLGWVTLSN
jgi:hypothetical protein